MEAIIRIAVLLNEKSKARPYQSLLKLLNKNVIPHAVQSHTDEFRRELQERDVNDRPPSALLLRALNSHSHAHRCEKCSNAIAWHYSASLPTTLPCRYASAGWFVSAVSARPGPAHGVDCECRLGHQPWPRATFCSS